MLFHEPYCDSSLSSHQSDNFEPLAVVDIIKLRFKSQKLVVKFTVNTMEWPYKSPVCTENLNVFFSIEMAPVDQPSGVIGCVNCKNKIIEKWSTRWKFNFQMRWEFNSAVNGSRRKNFWQIARFQSQKSGGGVLEGRTLWAPAYCVGKNGEWQ